LTTDNKDFKVKNGLVVQGNITTSADILAANLRSTNSSGDEGGEILLAKPQTNTSIAGSGVTIDVYQNKLRFFEQGGDARGFYIDITSGGNAVGTNLVGSGGGGGGSGTVTSVSLTAPNGLTVSGSPITTSGTIALTFTSGYSIPTTASQSNWDTSYGWGNHASAGYSLLTASQSFTGTQTVLSGSTTTVGLIAKAITSQTSNLQEWQNVSGTALAKVTASGEFQAVTIDGGSA
jgi:hypothetical protein